MNDQEIFREKSNEIFKLVLNGRRDITRQVDAIDLVEWNSIFLNLRIDMWGRNVNGRMHIPSFDVRGAGLDLFRLGLFAWIYSRQSCEDRAVRFFEDVGDGFSGVIFSMGGFSSVGLASEVLKSRRALIMRSSPKSSCLYLRGACLAFGIYDSSNPDFDGGLNLVNPPKKAMVINSSRQGFVGLSLWLMSLGALEGVELSLYHGWRSVISRLSYEVRFSKFEDC